MWCTTHCIICVYEAVTTTCNHIAAGWDPLKRYRLWEKIRRAMYTILYRWGGCDSLMCSTLFTQRDGKREERDSCHLELIHHPASKHSSPNFFYMYTFIQLSSPSSSSFFLFLLVGSLVLIFFDSVWRRKKKLCTYKNKRGQGLFKC